MTFSQDLRDENSDIFQAIFTHPFVQGIGKGNVPKEALEHYIKADFEYLNAFIQIYGMAISKSNDRRDMAFFNDQIQFVLHSEVHPHHNFCESIGVNYDELQGYALPPTADHYVKHMMYHAQTGTLAEIICALLPCPWTYLEIGKELMKTYKPADDHPFYKWIRFYADESVEKITTTMRNRLDELATEASIMEQKRMKEAFRKSCQLEWSFWEMAYTREEWPDAKLVGSR
ncbi:aminopyrimidine aminohydrolase [Lentibacillus populi]|uniref:Aminopyrimidine aminohydrolase n=1 Tax=Lentibacillus populi TaxID=1827502 RepID=A0A9W5TX63_9BACI|nr:thiaminase II [Lentibacillus populi]MBT2218268.1 thiaminase II [Virgibacillus dakarensis]GGB42680.1 aminopyrimidine aminohydrolase [Lentibacillus populi]